MADMIRCRECWYCVETPFKHRPDNDWCRMKECHIPKDNTKIRCKHYEVLKEEGE